MDACFIDYFVYSFGPSPLVESDVYLLMSNSSAPQKSPFSVLYEDTHLLVLNKSAGLLSQAADHSTEENLVDLLRVRFGRPYVGLVHRLDRNTSGLMVVAKRTKAAERLTNSLQEGRLIRRYLAWLVGDLQKQARWEHWLVKNERTNEVRASMIEPGRTAPRNAKASALTVRPRERRSFGGAFVTLAEFELETGRSHQIRAQALASGYPLLGDTKYATAQSRDLTFPRTALHSYYLEFPHPVPSALENKEPNGQLRFEIGLPPDLELD